MTPYDFYNEGVSMALARLDQIGEKLERAYSVLDQREALGQEVERTERMIRILEQQEEDALDRHVWLVAKRKEYAMAEAVARVTS